jgi:dienelactone hydrolase
MRRLITWPRQFGLALALLLVASVPVAAAELGIPFTINKPAGDGPFPAVVMMHDCSGLGPRSSGAPGRWSELLVAAGYVTILPDSFSSRGAPDGVCTKGSRGVATYWDRGADAKAALAYLQSLPYVDAKRVAVMGGSHGGSSTLAAIVANPGGSDGGQQGFAAAISLYPNCAARYGGWRAVREHPFSGAVVGYEGVFQPTAPLLILIGDADDWTPAAYCQEMAVRAQAEGYPVEIVVYPGAYHSFDSDRPVVFRGQRRNVNAPGGYGATTGGDPKAWADAKQRVSRFLAANLAKGR